MNIFKKIAIYISALLAITAFAAPAFAATNVVVSPANMNGWVLVNDTTDGTGSGTFVNGPATPPLGTGSVKFTLTGPSDGQIIEMPYGSTKLSTITKLLYSTYQDSANTSNAAAVSLGFNVDKDVTDADNSYQGRIVYEPYYNNGGTVSKGVWNQWDAVAGGNAKWWLSHSSSQFDNNCSQASPCTFTTLIGLYPNIGIHPTLGAVVFKAGSGYSDFTGYVDAFTMGVNGTDTTYDFEASYAPSVPTITTPANGATVTQSNFTKVDWSDSTDGSNPPTTYQYAAYSDAAYSNLVYQSGWLTASEIATTNTPIGDYYVQVRAEDGNGVPTAWSNDAAHPYVIHVVADQVVMTTPMHTADCKDNGWKTFNNPSFKNQGQCVDYVNKHNHKVNGNNVQYQVNGLNREADFDMDTASNKGNFTYTDGNKDKYKVNVSSVMVSGNTAWFAGQVTSAKNPSNVGKWLFAKVVDNGNSGDQIWGSFTDQTTAQNGVTTMSTPSDGPFTLFKGNIKVN